MRGGARCFWYEHETVAMYYFDGFKQSRKHKVLNAPAVCLVETWKGEMDGGGGEGGRSVLLV